MRALLLLPLALLLGSCRTSGTQADHGGLLDPTARHGLIAYVAEDGNVSVIDQDGGSWRAVTNDAARLADPQVIYTSPTWSPDGRSLAFVRLAVSGPDSVVEASLHTWGRDKGNVTRLFAGTRLQPFYLYWAPDSRRVSLLSSVKGEELMELGVATAGTEDDYRTLDRGSPFYWAWRKDSGSIVIHTNMGRAGRAAERLTLMDPAREGSGADVGVDAGVYQAPSFSPDGRSIAYASSTETGFALHVRSIDGTGDRLLASDLGGTFFSYSPDGKRVAYLAALAYQPLPQGRLTVVDVLGGAAPRTVPEEPVLAFFWSPDGKTIAFLVPDAEETADALFYQDSRVLYLRLMGMDPDTGRTWAIARFPPARGVFNVIPFFDQYRHSATIWSPDSRLLVFTALTPDGDPGLFVAGMDGVVRPRFLVAGDYAFWSGN